MLEVVEEVEHNELQEAPLPSRSATARVLVVFVMYCAAVPSVCGLFGRWGWLLNLCNHFRFQFAVMLFATTIALLLLRSWRKAGVAFGALLLNLIFVLPLYLGSPGPVDTSRATLTVMHFNVNTGNTDHAGVIAEIRSHGPGLLFVQEVNPRWVDALASGLSDYELVVDKPRTDNFGIACFVRKTSGNPPELTITSAQAYDITKGIAQVPVIEVALTLNGDTINVLSIHPLPPVSLGYARSRDTLLEAAGQWAAAQASLCIVVGDFNATPWSTAFRDLQSAGGLVNSQAGFGRAPTWPARFNTLGMIPIDHLLHSGGLVTADRVVGEARGSDHKPLVVEIGWHR